jgi:hypothetical protein
MFPVSTIVKWVVIGSIVTMLGVAVKKGYEYHLDQIDFAVNAAKTSLVLEQNALQKEREESLRAESIREKKVIETALKVERAKVTDLQRMLLINHDLDKLLQAKPGLILTRVNAGTEAYFKELEEATQ